MDWNDHLVKMAQFDNMNRQIDAISQINKFTEINERIERMTNPPWMKAITEMNERLDRLADPLGINKMLEHHERMERLANPFGKLTAFMEQQDKMLNWTKSLEVVSPAVTSTLDYFSKYDRMFKPIGLEAMLDKMNIGQSLNSVYSMIEKAAAIEKNFAFFDRLSELNYRAYHETNEVIAQAITLDDYQTSMMAMLREGFEQLKAELLKDGKPRSSELVKLLERWLTIISIIVTCIGIYVGVKGIVAASGKQTPAQEQVIRAQADTVRALKEFIQQSTKKLWVVNRKCRVYFKPVINSLIVDSIPALSCVDVIATRQKWVYVSYYLNDTTINAGWVDKNYVDTLRNLKRPGNNSKFNR